MKELSSREKTQNYKRSRGGIPSSANTSRIRGTPANISGSSSRQGALRLAGVPLNYTGPDSTKDKRETYLFIHSNRSYLPSEPRKVVMLPGPFHGGTTVPVPVSLIPHKPDNFVFSTPFGKPLVVFGLRSKSEGVIKVDVQIKHVTNLGFGSYCLFKSQY